MSDIEKYINSGRDINSKNKTEQCIGLFRAYLNEQFVLLEPKYLELNQLLCRFIVHLKRKNGTEYEPVTVRNKEGSIALGTYMKRSTSTSWSIRTSAICGKSSRAEGS